MYFEEKFNIYSQIILIAKEILSQIFSLKSMRKKKKTMLSPSPNLHSKILPFYSIFIFPDFVLF